MVLIPEPAEQTPRHGLGRDAKRAKPVWLRLLIILGVIAISLMIYVGVVSGFTYQLWGEPPFFDIVNEADQALIVVSVNSVGKELELDILQPGEKFSEQTSGCYPAELVVRTTNGDMYARQPHQLCADDVRTITDRDT